MIQRDHSEISEVLFKATILYLFHEALEIVRFARIFSTAGGRDDHITVALPQDRQSVNHDLMIVVPPELVWQIAELQRQPIMREYVSRIRGQQLGRRLCRKPDYRNVVS